MTDQRWFRRARRALMTAVLSTGIAVCLATSIPATANAAEGAADRSHAETKLRRALGIPDGAVHVLIVDQAAHNDYDWVCTFVDFYANPACARDFYNTDVSRLFDALFRGIFIEDIADDTPFNRTFLRPKTPRPEQTGPLISRRGYMPNIRGRPSGCAMA